MSPWRRSSLAASLSFSAVSVPVRGLPSEATARKKNVVAIELEFLRHADHFIRSGHAARNFLPAILAQIAHPAPPRHGGDDACVLVPHDRTSQFFLQLHQLENANPAAITSSKAMVASGAPERGNPLAVRRRRLACRLAALGADHAHEPLRQHR